MDRARLESQSIEVRGHVLRNGHVKLKTQGEKKAVTPAKDLSTAIGRGHRAQHRSMPACKRFRLVQYREREPRDTMNNVFGIPARSSSSV